MSQAALNTRNSEEEVSSRRNNGTRLAGILFLLTVLNDSVGERLGRVGLDGRCATPAALKAGVDR
ncbi:cell division protein FtsQ [Escherichia coli]|nr:cell division protein FtsQ [Escherichia coli]